MPSPTLTSPQELRSCLEHVAFGDTTTIRQASAVLHSFLRCNAAIQALTAQIADESNDPCCRQLAAVLLRQTATKRWSKVSTNEKAWVKQTLLHVFQTASLARPIRYSTGAVLAEIACRTSSLATAWPELLPSVQAMTGSPLPELREIGMMFFGAVIEILPRQMVKFFDTFQQVFLNGLSDTTNPVKSQALLGMSLLIEAAADSGDVTSDRLMQYRSFVTPLLQLLDNAAAQMDADATAAELVLAGLDLLESLVMYDAETILDELQQTQAVQLSCALLTKADMDDHEKIQRKAGCLIEELLQCECLNIHANLEQLARNHLLPTAWALCRQMVDEDELDAAEISLGNRNDIGCHILREMMLHLPDSMSVVPAYEFASAQLRNVAVEERRTAVSFLSMIVRDASDWLVQHQQVGPILTVLESTLNDPDCMVRFVTCVALSACVSNDAYHSIILDCLAPLTQAMCVRVISTEEHLAVSTLCCYFLDDVIPLFPDAQLTSSVHILMAQVVQPIMVGLQQQSPRAKVLALGCFDMISVMCECTESDVIQPFAGPIMQLIDAHLRSTVILPTFDDGELDELRLLAAMIRCGGSLITSLGYTPNTQPFLTSLMPAVTIALRLDDTWLSSSCFESAVAILKVLTASPAVGNQQPWIDAVLAFATRNVLTGDEIVQDDDTSNELTKPAHQQSQHEADEEDEEDEEDEDGTSERRLDRGARIRDASLECKVQSILFLSTALNTAATPQLQGCLSWMAGAAERLLHSVCENVRESTVELLRSMYNFSQKALVDRVQLTQATMAILGCLLDAVHYDLDCESVITNALKLVSEIMSTTSCTDVIDSQVRNAFMNAVTEHLINFRGTETVEFVGTCAGFLRAIAPTCSQNVIQDCVREVTEALQENYKAYEPYCAELQVLQPLGVVF